ncbi:TIGR00730 family Rossman fold protein [Duganella sp. FT80W]|uniref:Cytokinin riboside 5'-monophosphate phosphoribohydrolase n=1 Tax=Duganella guangzhouensis TaxID=2666084 RepID=A0A6I2L8L0_9BURK|nr:TIGR00730 family Rossman fold protein [Duganella guangzhouensis]
MVKSICVYCGANAGVSPKYAEAARALAAQLVQRNLSLVYGGGNVGLMGIIADEVLRLGGEVTGVIPTALVEREVGHTGLTRQFIVKDMHERKAMMAQLADGFIAMPGGMGTLEELFEMLTWSQLGIHAKPIGLLNVDGFYDGLAGFIDHASTQGFIRPQHAALMMVESEPEALLSRFAS